MPFCTAVFCAQKRATKMQHWLISGRLSPILPQPRGAGAAGQAPLCRCRHFAASCKLVHCNLCLICLFICGLNWPLKRGTSLSPFQVESPAAYKQAMTASKPPEKREVFQPPAAIRSPRTLFRAQCMAMPHMQGRARAAAKHGAAASRASSEPADQQEPTTSARASLHIGKEGS